MQTLHRSDEYRSAVFHHPMRLLAVGDSLVYGFGDPEGGGWVERLRRQWMSDGASGHILYNLGVRGDGVFNVIRRLESEFQYRGELRNRVPDGMILSVGVNDSARVGRLDGRNVTSLERFETAIAQLLDVACELCPVWFVGMIPVVEPRMPFLECFYFNHADQARFNAATRQACVVRRVPYLDLFELWQSRGQSWCESHMTEDGLHPNSGGYRAMLKDIQQWRSRSPMAIDSLSTVR